MKRVYINSDVKVSRKGGIIRASGTAKPVLRKKLTYIQARRKR